jgi:threonine dehydrogenase-like Zn-dependent dehydrogenase
MRAAIFRQGSFVLGDVPDPQLQPGQVLVRTRACGICGTDLHAARFTKEFVSLSQRSGGRWTMDTERDVVFGHEFMGEVVANGAYHRGQYRAWPGL